MLRGPYGKPNISGEDLVRSAQIAYNCALVWDISNDKAYTNKAIELINAWWPVLWDLDYTHVMI